MVEKKETTKKIGKDEIYKKIEELSKKGESSAKIGLELKKENVLKTKKEVGKKIGKIQKELKIKKEIPDDLMALIKRAVKLIKHKENNKKDTRGKRGYQLTISKINRLRKYYIKEGILAKDWRYSDEKAKLLVK
jgi:small subunit ribosomal protein S15